MGDIELNSVNGVTDDGKSPNSITGGYDYVDMDMESPAAAEAADSKNQGGMKRLAAAAPKPLSPDGSGEGKVHDYEELPSPNTPQSYGYLEPVDLQGAPAPVTAPNISQVAEGGARYKHDQYRRRKNPLYQTSVSGKSLDSDHVTGSTGGCPPCCLLVLVVISLLLAAAAASLAVVAISMQLTDRQKDSSTMPDNSESVTPRPSQVVEHIETVIQQLSQDVSQLRQQVESMQTLNTTQAALLDRLDQMESNLNLHVDNLQLLNATQLSLLHKLNLMEKNLEDTRSKLSEVRQELSGVSSALSDRIYNISKMPGPQGPTGPPGPEGTPCAWNMSACQHIRRVSGSPVDTPETRSLTLDLRRGVYKNWMLTGATCTTDTGTQAMLVYDNQAYHCICRGNISSTGSRFCTLHFWACPPTA